MLTVLDGTRNAYTNSMILLFAGPLKRKTTQASFQLVAKQSRGAAFSVEECANYTKAKTGIHGCFARINFTIIREIADGEIALELYGIPGGSITQTVELLPAKPRPKQSFSIAGLPYWQSIGVIIGGTFILIGLGAAGVKYRNQQSQLQEWNEHQHPFLRKNRISNLTVNSQASLKKTGLSDQLAVEWLVDFKKLKMGEKVGQGASAQVFKGFYCGQTVAVKRLYPR